jgi:hypothetical protein
MCEVKSRKIAKNKPQKQIIMIDSEKKWIAMNLFDVK